MNALEMREKRSELSKEIRRLADLAKEEGREFTAEEQEAWDKVGTEYNDWTRKLEFEERAESAEADQRIVLGHHKVTKEEMQSPEMQAHLDRKAKDSGLPTSEDRALAFQGWLRQQAGRSLDERHRRAAEIVGIDLYAKNLDFRLPGGYDVMRRRLKGQRLAGARPLTPEEFRATDYTSTVATFGGETIPEGFVFNFETALLAFGGMREVADVMRTATGNDLPWPTVNDTGNTGEQVGETADSDDSAVTELGITTSATIFKAFKFGSKMIRVTAELLEDSAFDMAAQLGLIMGERIGRITAAGYATGVGTTTINGLVTAATLGVTAASATTVDYDEIYNLIHSVDPAYRAQQAGFVMHDNVILAIRKLKDSDGRYLWQESTQVGVPDRIAGFPLQIDQGMASSIAASAKIILFGALGKYKIRDVAGLRVRRLGELFAQYDQEGFVAFFRTDGNLLDAGSNPVKYMQMASS